MNIEMKDQTGKSEEEEIPHKTVPGLTTEAKRKMQMQNGIKKLVTQLKVGCEKDICFSRYCRKNKLAGK